MISIYKLANQFLEIIAQKDLGDHCDFLRDIIVTGINTGQHGIDNFFVDNWKKILNGLSLHLIFATCLVILSLSSIICACCSTYWHCKGTEHTKMKRFGVKYYVSVGVMSIMLVGFLLFFLVQITTIDEDISNKLIDKKGWGYDLKNSTKYLRTTSKVYIDEIIDIVDRVFTRVDAFINKYLYLSYNSVKKFDEELGVSKTLDEVNLVAEMTDRVAVDMLKIAKYSEEWVEKLIISFEHTHIINKEDELIALTQVINISNALVENAKFLTEMTRVGKRNFYLLDFRIYSFYGDYAAPYVKLVKDMIDEIKPQVTQYKHYLYTDYLGSLENLETSLSDNQGLIAEVGYAGKYLNYMLMFVPLIIIFVLFSGVLAVSFMRIKSEDESFNKYLDQCNRSINYSSIAGLLIIFFLAILFVLLFSFLSFAYTDGCQCAKRLLGNPGDPMNKADIKRISEAIDLEGLGLPVTFEALLLNFYDNQTIFSSLDLMSFIQDHMSELELDIKKIINLLPQFIGIFWINFRGVNVFEMNPIKTLEQNIELLQRYVYFENINIIDCKNIETLFDQELLSRSNLSSSILQTNVNNDIVSRATHNSEYLCTSLNQLRTHLSEFEKAKEALIVQCHKAIEESNNLSHSLDIEDTFDPLKNMKRNDQLMGIFVNVTNELAELGSDIFDDVMKLPDILSHQNTGMRPLIDSINSFLTETICDDIIWTLDGLWFSHSWFLFSLFIFIVISKITVWRTIVRNNPPMESESDCTDEYINIDLYPKNFVEIKLTQ